MSNTKKMMEVIREIVTYYSKDLELAKSIDTDAIAQSMDSGKPDPELKSILFKVMQRVFDLNAFLIRIDFIFDDSAGLHPSVGTSDDRLDMTSMQYYQAIRARIVVSTANFDKFLPYIIQTHPDIDLYKCEDFGKVFGEIMKESISRAEGILNGLSLPVRK